MKRSNSKVVVTCEYHGCVLAIGESDGKRFTTNVYTPRFRERGEECIHCPHAKLYFMDGEGNIRERNGAGKSGIEKIKLGGEEVSYKKIAEKARELGFPYL